jgi:hypothetical protein
MEKKEQDIHFSTVIAMTKKEPVKQLSMSGV